MCKELTTTIMTTVICRHLTKLRNSPWRWSYEHFYSMYHCILPVMVEASSGGQWKHKNLGKVKTTMRWTQPESAKGTSIHKVRVRWGVRHHLRLIFPYQEYGCHFDAYNVVMDQSRRLVRGSPMCWCSVRFSKLR